MFLKCVSSDKPHKLFLWNYSDIKSGKLMPKSNKNIFKKNANHMIKLFTY